MKHQFRAPRNIVTCLEFDPLNGNHLYQGSEDLQVRLWDVRAPSGQPAETFAGYVYFPLCIDVQEYCMVTGTKGFDAIGCELKVWDTRQAGHGFVHSIQAHSQDVTDCVFVGPGKVLTVSKDGGIGVWGTSGGVKTAGYRDIDRIYTSAVLMEEVSSNDLPSITIGCLDGSAHRLGE